MLLGFNYGPRRKECQRPSIIKSTTIHCHLLYIFRQSTRSGIWSLFSKTTECNVTFEFKGDLRSENTWKAVSNCNKASPLLICFEHLCWLLFMIANKFEAEYNTLVCWASSIGFHVSSDMRESNCCIKLLSSASTYTLYKTFSWQK